MVTKTDRIHGADMFRLKQSHGLANKMPFKRGKSDENVLHTNLVPEDLNKFEVTEVHPLSEQDGSVNGSWPFEYRQFCPRQLGPGTKLVQGACVS